LLSYCLSSLSLPLSLSLFVTGTGKGRFFPVPMHLNRGCCGCPRGCRYLPSRLEGWK